MGGLITEVLLWGVYYFVVEMREREDVDSWISLDMSMIWICYTERCSPHIKLTFPQRSQNRRQGVSVAQSLSRYTRNEGRSIPAMRMCDSLTHHLKGT